MGEKAEIACALCIVLVGIGLCLWIPVYISWALLGCHYYECCGKPWITQDTHRLQENLTSSVYGQHIASEIILKTIKGHVLNPNPQKALALLFLGTTGIGKTYVSKFIAESLYIEGMNSQYVHKFIATAHFPHKDKVDVYMDELKKLIISSVGKCERNLFIFDEIHEMHPKLLAMMKPYLDHHNKVDGIDFRKSIFIFLGNNAASSIAHIAYKRWLDGEARETLTLKDFDKSLKIATFNEHGGLTENPLIAHELIDAYIPFLPLEKKHVYKCISDDIHGKYGISVSDATIRAMADELDFFPDDTKLYSETGCKRVPVKVDQHISMP